MLTLDQAKAFLRVTSDEDDADIAAQLVTVQAAFRVESKRRWPAVGEPALTQVIDPDADPLAFRFVRWADPVVLSPDEQELAGQWMRFTLGHWYENRQSVAVGLNVTEVPDTARRLMSMLREPTI